MSDGLPEFARDVTDSAKGGADSVKNAVRSALPWLPDPFTCEHCGSACEAIQAFVERQAMYMPVYECTQCGSQYHRDESEGLGRYSFDPYDR